MSGILNFALDKLKSRMAEACQDGNVGSSERILSVVAGGFIFAMGVKSVVKNPLTAFSGLTLGGALIYRGVTGHCAVKDAIEGKKPETTIVEHRYFVK
ncbi:YgaP family membrane protein [Sphingobacterium sp. HJSM2_6]|uniref:YgaP family membrane protein n=1 Tax=Sphingobacterium sp. HJSM2_6 TaxID=3366264 RepID=UPI003BC23AF1